MWDCDRAETKRSWQNSDRMHFYPPCMLVTSTTRYKGFMLGGDQEVMVGKHDLEVASSNLG